MLELQDFVKTHELKELLKINGLSKQTIGKINNKLIEYSELSTIELNDILSEIELIQNDLDELNQRLKNLLTKIKKKQN